MPGVVVLAAAVRLGASTLVSPTLARTEEGDETTDGGGEEQGGREHWGKGLMESRLDQEGKLDREASS